MAVASSTPSSVCCPWSDKEAQSRHPNYSPLIPGDLSKVNHPPLTTNTFTHVTLGALQTPPRPPPPPPPPSPPTREEDSRDTILVRFVRPLKSATRLIDKTVRYRDRTERRRSFDRGMPAPLAQVGRAPTAGSTCGTDKECAPPPPRPSYRQIRRYDARGGKTEI